MAVLWFLLFSPLCSLFLIMTDAEIINYLPGQPEKVNFKHYSGNIISDDYYGRSFFYYFVEAQSKHALTLPLTFWLGGGHGCSSAGSSIFDGNGPFRSRKDGKLIHNVFSWNIESNMLYVDSIVGSGFSFSNTSLDYTKWNYTMTVNENMKFLLKWFEEFPKYRNLDFYLAGDDSEGHLVPQLAALMLEYNKNNVKPIKLKGIALGNLGIGTPGIDEGDNLWYHGVISKELYTILKTVCNETKAIQEGHRGKLSNGCKKMSNMLDAELGVDFNVDSFLLQMCFSKKCRMRGNVVCKQCPSDDTSVYLNKPEVQKALHANKTHLPYRWDSCAGPLTLLPAFETKNFNTLTSLLKRHIRVLLYSGDQDIFIPAVETRKFARMLAKDLKLIHLQKNRPWYNGPQVGGWSEAFGKLTKGKNVTYLTFASVKGGSHFVPSSSPSEALTLFKAFLKGSSLTVSN